MKVTVEFNLKDEALRKVMEVFSCLDTKDGQTEPVESVQQEQNPPVPSQTSAPIQPAPVQTAVPVQQTTGQIVQTPAPVQTVAPTVPPQTSVPTQTVSYTMEQLARAATQLVDAKGQQVILDLLGRFQVATLTELPTEQYGAFATELRTMGAKI